jgi:hypothetical protein
MPAALAEPDRLAQIRRRFLALGIPTEFAVEAIRNAASRKLGDAPASIAWFRSRVLDLWSEREHNVRKHGTENGQQAPRPHMQKAAPLADVVENLVAPELAQDREDYDAAKKAAAIAWGKDPANAAAYAAIVQTENESHDPDLLKASLWIQKARDLGILARILQVVPFPEFDVWRDERHKGAEQPPSR